MARTAAAQPRSWVRLLRERFGLTTADELGVRQASAVCRVWYSFASTARQEAVLESDRREPTANAP